MKPVIHSQKHYVQFSLFNVAAGTRTPTDLIIATEGTVANLVNEVIEGAIVKAVYIELWTDQDGPNGFEIVTLTKATAGSLGPSVGEMAALGTYDEKKNVFFTHEGLAANESVNGPYPVMKGWYKIPKSKQRFGLGDRLVLSISNPSANNSNACGFATYKEYT